MESRIEAKPLFAATLTPHRALSARASRIVMGLAALLALLPGLLLARLGAWPILGFLGFGTLGVWWALSSSNNTGRLREQITLWPDVLELQRVSVKGVADTLVFSPFSVRLIIDRDFEERITAINLRADGHDVEIGAFLNADDKASFSQAFGTALRKARG